MTDISELRSVELLASQPCINLNNFDEVRQMNDQVLNTCINDLNLVYLKCCRIDTDDPSNRDIDFCYDEDVISGFLEETSSQATAGIDLQFLAATSPPIEGEPLRDVYYSDFIAPYTNIDGCLIELTANMEICFSKDPQTTFNFFFELEIGCQGSTVPLATQGFSGASLNTSGSVDCLTYPVELVWYIERYSCIEDLVLRWKNPVITPAGTNTKGLTLRFSDMCLKGACN